MSSSKSWWHPSQRPEKATESDRGVQILDAVRIGTNGDSDEFKAKRQPPHVVGSIEGLGDGNKGLQAS